MGDKEPCEWIRSNKDESLADPNAEIQVKTRDGQLLTLTYKDTSSCLPSSTEGKQDILDLDDFSEDSLMWTLRLRYTRGQWYTYVGPILISINPFQWNKELYSTEQMQQYKSLRNRKLLPPHLFAVADTALQNLRGVGKEVCKLTNQSIIISGESGAGKTEATKLIMTYLARVTGSSSKTNKEDHGEEKTGELEERVLRTNPVLESFGNAKTLRNDNSSRFGKYIQIELGKMNGTIVGATISTFLLEKVRIVRQNTNERNFHIFYELFYMDMALRNDLLNAASYTDPEGKIDSKVSLAPSYFHYLNQSGVDQVDSIDDQQDYTTTMAAMQTMGIDHSTVKHIFQVLYGILFLGNVQFEVDPNDSGEKCVPVSSSKDTTSVFINSMRVVCNVLGFEYQNIVSALCERKMSVGDVSVNQTVQQALDNRDALAKALYSHLFDWLVTRLNETIATQGVTSTTSTNSEFIGLLDIFGFEIFKINSFEQLCINYANERLQRHFNQYMLEMEQIIYEEEGINWQRITFSDNQECLDLIDGKVNGQTPGVFLTLDDKFRVVGAKADTEFLKALHKTYGKRSMRALVGNVVAAAKKEESPKKKTSKWSNLRAQVIKKKTNKTVDGLHPYYVRPRLTHQTHFGIKHYAGVVEYDVKGFNLKNIESFGEDIKQLCATSTFSFMTQVFNTTKKVMKSSSGAAFGATTTPKKSRRASFSLRNQSVSSQFKNQLSMLMTELKATTPHYIRCVKPNQKKQPNMLVPDDCLRQLKHAGMMEVVRIRQQGFATREDHLDFLNRHRAIFPSAKTPQELFVKLQLMFQFNENDFQIGKTKVFLQHGLSEKLEAMATIRYKFAVRKLQRCGRRYLAVKEEKMKQRSAVLLQTHVRRFVKRHQHLRRLKQTLQIQTLVRGFLVQKNYLTVLRTSKLKEIRLRYAGKRLYTHIKLYLKRLKQMKNNIETIKKKHIKDIQCIEKKLVNVEQENMKLKLLLEKHRIQVPQVDVHEEEQQLETVETAETAETAEMVETVETATLQTPVEDGGNDDSGGAPSPTVATPKYTLTSEMNHELEAAKSEIRSLKLALNKEKHLKELELSKMALTTAANKTKGRRSDMVADNLKSENNQLMVDIARATQKLSMKENAEREAFLRLRNVLNPKPRNSKDYSQDSRGTGGGEGGEEEEEGEEEEGDVSFEEGEMDLVYQSRSSPSHSECGGGEQNWNFELQLDHLIHAYEEKRSWKDSMDNQVASLSTKLDKYSREGGVEREHLNKYESTVQEMRMLQKKHASTLSRMSGKMKELFWSCLLELPFGVAFWSCLLESPLEFLCLVFVFFPTHFYFVLCWKI
jgi:myosin heavy subunit